MTIAYGYVAPSTAGAILVGDPQTEELQIKTIDTGYARVGRLVMLDTDDAHCKVAGAGEARVIGYIQFESSNGKDSDANGVDSDFTAEDPIRIGHGPAVVLLYATTGQTIVKGDLLYPAAHGALKNSATSTESAVAKAEKSVTTTTLAEDEILVRWLN